MTSTDDELDLDQLALLVDLGRQDSPQWHTSVLVLTTAGGFSEGSNMMEWDLLLGVALSYTS
jgi:hypothetical protein